MILPIELYDEDGRKINDERLKTSIKEVQCVATILETKEVPLRYALLNIWFSLILIILFIFYNKIKSHLAWLLA